MHFVQYGLRMRRESATLVHEHSSRSHLIVTLTVISQAPSFFAKPQTPTTPDPNAGEIVLVDFLMVTCFYVVRQFHCFS